jgi:N-acyl-D-amino-acid deacylase
MYDLILRGGTLYDGGGGPPITGDIAIQGDSIAAIDSHLSERGQTEIDVSGLAVAPGFINMLSWSSESLIEDGRSQSEIRQGVTLEVMGEGFSYGPLSPEMKPLNLIGTGDIHFDIEWTTLGEYLDYLERRGVSTNIASFVGFGTLRTYALGFENRPPTPDELDLMRRLARQAMQEGAVGMSTALIYSPEFYAKTDEIIELAKVVSEYDGLYISHVRGEGATLLDAYEELFTIAREANVRAEIYHMKAAGRANWDKMDEAIRRVEAARAEGLDITADMYTYPFSGTGLDACLPPWVHEGGHDALTARLRDPATRDRIRQDMNTPSDAWENMYLGNTPDSILLSGFHKEYMKPLSGKTLAQVAAERGTPPEDTLMDLIVEDDSRVFTMYFSMSEDNLRKQVALPWMAFCSDAASIAPEGVFLKSNPHPRAYGSFARVLGKYVRDEGLVPLEEAVRRLTAFPAANLKIWRRGWLQTGFYADIAVFDPARVQDYATPQDPHRYSEGMVHVLVNGVPVLRDGDHTGAKPGRVVRGPGWHGKQ